MFLFSAVVRLMLSTRGSGNSKKSYSSSCSPWYFPYPQHNQQGVNRVSVLLSSHKENLSFD